MCTTILLRWVLLIFLALGEFKPERILSPFTVLKRQRGNSFEYATLLASFLIGANIDAYVVFGYATREFTLGIFNGKPCPDQFDPPKPEPKKVIPVRKYKVNQGTDFRSKHLMNREQMRKDVITARQLKEREEYERQIEELERPRPDELYGWRVHAWVLVLPPRKKGTEVADKEESQTEVEVEYDEEGNVIERVKEEEPTEPIERVPSAEDVVEDEVAVEEGEEEEEGGEGGEEEKIADEVKEDAIFEPEIAMPFYIEPSTGFRYDIDREEYLQVETIYNHKNYYVNLQHERVPENFDVWNRHCWLKFLPEMEEEAAKKQFDMPTSWVERLDISDAEFEERYPGGKKIIRYKKQILEKFAPYSTMDGILRRWCKYSDYAYKRLRYKHEWFDRRPDNLLEISYDYDDGIIIEYFKRGREDYLKENKYEMSNPDTCLDCNRKLDFFDEPRFDHLSRMTTTSNTLSEEYINREDGLYSRDIEFGEFNGEGEETHRSVILVTEQFHRHPELPAAEDVALKTFYVAMMEIKLLFHYEDNFVTKSTRTFFKPNLMDTGGVLSYVPEMTDGYVANPQSKPPNELKKYTLLVQYMKEEEDALRQVRESEKLLAECIRLRAVERTVAADRIKLFDVERNEVAKAGLAAKEAAEKETKERELRADMSPRSATLGLRDFVQTQLARQSLTQSRYDELTTALKEQRLWYLNHQYIISSHDEALYLKKRELMTFEVSTLEVQLERQRVLSHARYEHLVNLVHANSLTTLDG